MGLFDKLTGGKEVQLSAKSALALAAMTMIGADGSIEDEELASLRRIVRGDDRAFDQAFRVFKDKPASECVSLVGKALNDKQKMATIANLLDIAMADGILAGSEKDLMEKYIANFQIPEDALKDIIDFVAIKNDFSIFEQS